MNAVVYLFQVSACMGIFYLFYYALLSRFTFFTINRWFLIITLAISFIIPLLTITVQQQETYPQVIQQVVYINKMQVPQEVVITGEAPRQVQINWMALLRLAYTLSVGALSIRLLLIVVKFLTRVRNKKRMKIAGVHIVKGDKHLSNGSFFNYIFLNDDELSAEELEQIIAHEMLHVKLYHSVDRILVKVAQVFLWFNPFVYLYARAIEENHEFEVDRSISNSTDRNKYAELLFHLSVARQGTLYHNFSMVPLKKRITMLFTKPTNRIKKVIYLLVVPVVLVSCLAFAKLKNEDKISKTKNTSLLANDGQLKESIVKKPFFSRVRMKKSDGTYYDMATIQRSSGSMASDNITIDAKIGFIIKNKLYNENDFRRLFSVDKAEYGKTITVAPKKDFRFLGKHKFNLKDYDLIFDFREVDPSIFKSTAHKGKAVVSANAIDTPKLSAINGIESLGAKPLVLIDNVEYNKDILYKISGRGIKATSIYPPNNGNTKYGEKAKDGAVVIDTRDGEINYLTALEINNLKKIKAAKSKFFSRITLTNEDGSKYDMAFLNRKRGFGASASLARDGKIAFIINNRVYNEAAFKRLFKADKASYGPSIGVGRASKELAARGFKLEGYNLVFEFDPGAKLKVAGTLVKTGAILPGKQQADKPSFLSGVAGKNRVFAVTVKYPGGSSNSARRSLSGSDIIGLRGYPNFSVGSVRPYFPAKNPGISSDEADKLNDSSTGEIKKTNEATVPAAKDTVSSNTKNTKQLLAMSFGFEVKADGSVWINNQRVNKVRINGKDYTEGNVGQAIKTLPTEIVEKFSNSAAENGSSKPVNVLSITTKPDKANEKVKD